MDGSTMVMLSIFLMTQTALVAITAYNAHLKTRQLKDSERVSRAFEALIAQQEVNKRVQALFHRRLNRHRTLLIALYEGLEGAARGVSEEETLKKLEKFADVIKAHSKSSEIDLT